MLSTLNDLIARERAGEVIERSLIRATTQVRRGGGGAARGGDARGSMRPPSSGGAAWGSACRGTVYGDH